MEKVTKHHDIQCKLKNYETKHDLITSVLKFKIVNFNVLQRVYSSFIIYSNRLSTPATNKYCQF